MKVSDKKQLKARATGNRKRSHQGRGVKMIFPCPCHLIWPYVSLALLPSSLLLPLSEDNTVDLSSSKKEKRVSDKKQSLRSKGNRKQEEKKVGERSHFSCF
jgi:hypothetical protein